MRLFGLEITRSKAVPEQGMSVPVGRGISWVLGPVMEGFAGAWQRHIATESNENILRFSAVYGCISRIANDISILRPMLMSILDNGIWKEVRKGSPYLTVLQRPNPYQNWIQLLSYWIICKLIYGNAYLLKEYDNRRVVIGLYPIDPRSVMPKVAGNGDVYYDISSNVLAGLPEGKTLVPAMDILHDRINCLWHPLVGVGAIYACASTATQGIRIQNNSAKFFENMSRPSGHLSHPGTISPDQMANLKRQFEEGFSAGNLGRLLVTGGDAKYTPMTIPAEQSQLIEQLRWTVEDVCRCFHVPLHKVAAGQMPTFSNIGALNQQYYDECLKIHVEAIERLLTDELRVGPDYGIQLETEETMLRMDPLTRAQRTEILIRAGTLSPNEARYLENLEPVKGGEKPILQQQNWPIDLLAERDPPAEAAVAAGGVPSDPPDDEPEDDEDEAKAAVMQTAALLETIQKGFELEPV